MKIVINSKIGSFNVTRRIATKLAERGVQPAIDELDLMKDEDLFHSLGEHYPLFNVNRNDPALVKTIEQYNNEVPHLKIIEIPDDVKFYIFTNEMGVESIHEEHRTWE